MSYPQVTVVGSELGRPDDGTDPTGFFNWNSTSACALQRQDLEAGSIHTKEELIDDLDKKLAAYPGSHL